MPQDTLELGKLLVSEIEDHGSEDTLTVWLIHYIAELIAKAEAEGDSLEGHAAKKEACGTILKLWEHRATLAGRANPMKEYEQALHLLHKLSNEGYFVFRGVDMWNGDPVEQFRQGAANLLSSLLVLMLPSTTEGDDIAARNLSKAERKLIHELQVIRIRRVVINIDSEKEEDPREALKRDLLEDAARLRKSLDAIEAMLVTK